MVRLGWCTASCMVCESDAAAPLVVAVEWGDVVWPLPRAGRRVSPVAMRGASPRHRTRAPPLTAHTQCPPGRLAQVAAPAATWVGAGKLRPRGKFRRAFTANFYHGSSRMKVGHLYSQNVTRVGPSTMQACRGCPVMGVAMFSSTGTLIGPTISRVWPHDC